ncbi:MAG: hypothetical protein RSG50_03030 [Clostridia bacterium]
MAKKLAQRIVAIVLVALAAVLMVIGVIGLGKRTSAEGQTLLSSMRARSLLEATGEGVVESYVAIAKKEATAKVKAEGGSMSDMRAAVAAAEKQAREGNTASTIDYETTDTAQLEASVTELEGALLAYYAEKTRAEEAYADEMWASGELAAAQEAALMEKSAAPADAEGTSSGMDDMALDTEAEVDMSGFVATDEMNRLMQVADEKYLLVSAAIKGIYPVLDDDALITLKSTITFLVCQPGDTYTTMFDRFNQSGGGAALADSGWTAQIIRYGDDLITVAVGLIILAALVLFYQVLVKKLGLPRLIIGMFFVLLCVLSMIYDLSLSKLLSNTIVRMGMNSILVLAMVPGIQCGISLNLGLPIGIVGGLLGGLLCIELGYSGWLGFLFAIAVGVVISIVCGYLYGLLLNRLKGSEMAVTTYVGFSVVSLMCIAWLVLPFQSLQLRWPMGPGLRNTLSMQSSFKHILDSLWSFKIGSFTVPTGLLLFMLLCCFLVWLFSRSRTGVAMQAAGNNPRFAEATGINVDKMRIIGTILSTALGAIGILVYSQSYGFMQLYTAPRQMGFIAASAILIGGASTSRCKISHVLIGTFLFQGVLTLGMPVANVLVPQSTISETMRILISNGIILYALTKSGGESRA